MAIRNITRARFEAFNPTCSPLATLISEEKEWYVDDAGNILGIVLVDPHGQARGTFSQNKLRLT